jgi:ribosomal protein S18 acetylase RimI-like enzyme
MDYTIRNLKDSDYPEMEEMFTCVFPDSETGLPDAFEYRVENLSKGIYLDSGELAGFILCDVDGDHFEKIKINYIVIHPAFQKQGFGSILLQEIVRICLKIKKQVTLVPVMRLHILRWYRKQGFRISKVCDASGGGKMYEMSYRVKAQA